jgi:hypothetical protein
MKAWIPLFATVALPLALCLLAAAADDAPGKSTFRFKITTRKADDRVEVRQEKGKALLVITSPFGISNATVERRGDDWPKAVVLRLHLKGLSHFQAFGSAARVEASVTGENGKPKMRQWKDGKEDQSLDEKSPLWMTVRLVGADGKPARELPLKDGYFEVTLPPGLFAGNPKEITVSWIDFYRQ